jgi:hypothetical protein
MIAAIARHVSLVTGFAASIASIIPGLLLWPRVGQSAFGAVFSRAYLVEMAVIGAVILVLLLMRAAVSRPAVWVAGGLASAFAAAIGVTVGGLYAPAAVLFVLSGLLGEAGPHRSPIRHLLLAAGAALLQLGIMTLPA